MATIDTLESKLSSLLPKLATLEINKNFFNSKFPDGIDIGASPPRTIAILGDSITNNSGTWPARFDNA